MKCCLGSPPRPLRVSPDRHPELTGRLPLQGVPLIVLFGVWLLGRIAMASSAVIGGVLAAIVDVSFLALLFAVVCREIVAGRNWRNLPVLAPWRY